MKDQSTADAPAPHRAEPWWRRLVALAVFAVGLAYVILIHDFLAITRPVGGEVLVVESWFAESSAMDDAAKAAQHGHYRYVVCVALLESPGQPKAETDAHRAAGRLVALGVDPKLIDIVDVPAVASDRTYACAVAVRAYLQKLPAPIRSIDIFTVGIHARKSHLLYRKALPPALAVGIIAGTETAYPVAHWWISPRGVYLMLRNTAGYLYALVHPVAEIPAGSSESQTGRTKP